MKFSFFLLAAFILASCHKTFDAITTTPAIHTEGQFTQYTIREGQQYCDKNAFLPIETAEMKFVARFDSSAIYQSVISGNQYDINKLYGFSDNNKDHHQFSARFGWRWSDGALRLFAYVYNDGGMREKELCTVAIGTDITCSIKVAGNQYLFTVNDTTEPMPRTSTTEKGIGYQLYPYFGGDELAPHEVRIWIRDIK